MMLRVLKDKLIKLWRGEDGAAFVITLAVFMFMYLVCMGVYAIGDSVKTRIHLQNAADAAAYSAAVVQADTLSRVATINRAMSWTYVQMTRRQMDWVVRQWTEEAARHWRADEARARSWASSSVCTCGNPLHHGLDWHVSSITLHGATGAGVTTASIIDGTKMKFDSAHSGDRSFYSSPQMQMQIDADRETLKEMRNAIDSLKNGLRGRINSVVAQIVVANTAGLGVVAMHDVVSGDVEKYMEDLSNTSDNEDRFLSFAANNRASEEFGNSGQSWFPRKTSDAYGFRRGYDWGREILKATWDWHSYRWTCYRASTGADVHVGPRPCPSCGHSHDRCTCTGGAGRYNAVCYADNSISRDGYYETPSEFCARPVVLNRKYFDKEGTITVAVVVENENPWASILGDVSAGIFSAFNPFTRYTVCFTSAKAGYKHLGEDGLSREYRIDWEGSADRWYEPKQSWNLCQSDWDAVLIPVRRAELPAVEGSWRNGNMSFLGEYAARLGVSDSDMRAGPADDRWLIGNPNAELDFDGLQKVMFH